MKKQTSPANSKNESDALKAQIERLKKENQLLHDKIASLENDNNHNNNAVNSISPSDKTEENENRFRALSLLASDYLYSLKVNEDGSLENEWALGAFVRITGYDEKEIWEMGGLGVLILPEDLHMAMERVSRQLKGETVTSVLRIRTRSGDIRWIRDTAMPEWDRNHERVVRILGYALDITGQVMAEDALLKSEEMYRRVVETSLEGIWIIDKDHLITYANPAIVQMLEYQPEDMPGHPMEEFIFQEDLSEHYAEMERRHSGESGLYERRLRKKDGSAIWTLISATSVLDDLGQFVGAFAMISDISSRKNAEAIVQRRDELLRSIARISSAFLVTENIQNAAREALEILGNVIVPGRIFIGRKINAAPGSEKKYFHLQAEWLAEGIKNSDTEAVSKQIIPAFPDTINSLLHEGKVFYTTRNQSGEDVRKYMSQQQVLSILLIPLMTDGVNWGVLGFEYMACEHEWLEYELTLLQTVASVFEAAIRNRNNTEALQQSENRNRALLEANPDMMFVFRFDGTVVDFKADDQNSLFLPPSEFLGKKIQTLLPPDIASLTMEMIRTLAATGDTQYYEYSLDLHGIREFESRLVLCGQEECLAIVRDITEQKKAIRKLHHTEARFKSYFSSAPNDIIIIDQNYFINFLNRPGTGQIPDGMLHRKITEMINPDYHKQVEEALHRLKNEGQQQLVLLCSMGKWYEWSMGIVDGDSEAREFIIIATDINERISNQKIIEEAEARHRTLLNTMHEGVALNEFVFDSNGEICDYRVLEVNAGFDNHSQTPGAQVIGKLASEVYQMDKRFIREFWNSKKDITTSTVSDYQNFRGRWIRVITSPIIDNKFTTVFYDITESRLVEERIQKSEARNRALIENISDVIGIMRADGIITYKSPNLEKWFGWKPEELIGENGWKTVHPEDIGWLSQAFASLLQHEGEAQTVVYRYQCKNGEYRWIELTANNRISDPSIGGILLNYHDITQKKSAQETLFQSEKRLRKILETAKEGFWLVSNDGIILEVNEAYCHMSGYTREEMLGMHIADLEFIESRADVENHMNNIRQKGNDIFESIHKRKDGSRFNVSVSISALPNQGSMMGFFRDISHQRREQNILLARLRISDFARDHTLSELLQKTLDEAELLTGSNIGFYHFVDDNQDTIHLQMWSTNTLQTMCTLREQGNHYPVSQAGIWVECMHTKKPSIHNDYQNIPNKKGYPVGHAHLVREMVIPVIRGGKVKAILGLGNKDRDYTSEDVEAISFLSDLSWEIMEWKQMEEARKDTDYRLSLALEGTGAGLWDWNLLSGKMTFNENLVRMVGYKLSELSPITVDTWNTLCHPEDLIRSNEHLRAHMEGKTVYYECELRLKHKNGNWIWIQDIGRISAWDGSGKPTRMTGLHFDITARKEYEEQLQFNSLILDNISDMVVATDMNGTITYLNDAELSILEKSREELMGKSVQVFGESVEYGATQEEILQSTITKGFWRGEVVNFTSAGKPLILDARTRVIKNEDGLSIGMVGISSDITDRIRNEKALQESERSLSAIIDNSPLIMMLLDSEMKVMMMNQTGLDNLHLDNVNIQGLMPGNLFCCKNFKLDSTCGEHGSVCASCGIQKAIRLTQKTGKPVFKLEVELNTETVHDSHLKTVLVSTSLITIQGKPSVLLSIDNITERKMLERDLLKAKEKAEEHDKLKSSFLANMSHEIRTPMNGIIGFSELLTKPLLEEDKRKRYADLIKTSGHRLLTIVNDILDISKIETGQIDLFLTEVNLHEILDDLKTFYVPKASEAGSSLELVIERPLRMPLVRTDKTRLYQVIGNLLSNAIKYTQEGSIRFGYDVRNNELIFFVKDTGTGIEPEYHSIIFDRFRQGDLKRSIEKGGTGLGLSIAKNLVELLGGRIWLESTPGTGSTFFFSHPLQYSETNDSGVEEKPMPEYSIPFTEPLILIAEDEEINFIFLQEIVSTLPAKIIHVETGNEAVDICYKNPDISLVLMDIKMPVMDGLEATKQILQFRPGLPIIAVSAYALPMEKEQAIEAGVSEYIVKPSPEEVILDVIKEHLSRNMKR